jgi:DNA mismatch endonuclease (patch repair protein)
MVPREFETDAETSRRMSRIRQRSTRPELAVRLVLAAAGIRYRCNCRSLPGSPDIANKSRRWAIFVHGCFWHGHHGCSKATVPKRNRKQWLQKLRENRQRDERKALALREAGFRVVVVWECEARQLTAAGGGAASTELASLLRRLKAPAATPPDRRRRRPK